jgi:hypothetical protein
LSGKAFQTPPSAGFVGVLMLDTQFPRPIGDIGNPLTFQGLDFAVRYRTVPRAWPSTAVSANADALFDAFLANGHDLVREGARLITTSCGFLVRFQHELAANLAVPVLTSSLMGAPKFGAAILTINSNELVPSLLTAAGLPVTTPVVGVEEDCEFQRCILGNNKHMNLARAQADVVGAAQKLIRQYPNTQTIVLECTNMVPYAQAIATSTGKPVVHLINLIAQAWDAQKSSTERPV